MADPISYRIPRQRLSLVRDGSLRSTWKQFSNSSDAFDFARERLYADAAKEQFHVLMLDGKNRLIGVSLVSQGSLSISVVCPRDVFSPAIVSNSAAVIFLHNHPSGDPAPSREDRECTTRLHQAGILLGIRVLDHIVCGDVDYFSFADAGCLQA
jgi:DNA repair protein RadC